MSLIFDADSHVMEVGDWLPSYADPQIRDQLAPFMLEGAGAGARKLMDSLPGLWAKHREEADAIDAEVIKGPKGWMAPGALDTAVRSKVLDALGITRRLRLAGGRLHDEPAA